MSARQLIVLVVAAVAAIGALFLIRGMGGNRAQPTAETAAPIAGEQVLVAARDVPQGAALTPSDLAVALFPTGSVSPGFVQISSQPSAQTDFVGAVTRRAFAQGEPITTASVVQPDGRGFMAAQLPPGFRAVAIEVSKETAAGGFIQPNDHVDVVVTREVAGNANTMQNIRSDMILQNIRVLAIDGIYAPPPKEGMAAVLIGTRATLELTQQDAGLLSTAKKAGELSIALRSIADIQAPSGATMTGRVYRDGMAQGAGADGVRVYRYGTETVSKAPAG